MTDASGLQGGGLLGRLWGAGVSLKEITFRPMYNPDWVMGFEVFEPSEPLELLLCSIQEKDFLANLASSCSALRMWNLASRALSAKNLIHLAESKTQTVAGVALVY